ncbi:TonB-dependent hemoglobin/transferrin/lactoferrin family receptor [Steroidobacter sp. S1-65]|uniref:TonB-dependent hemoglobin/transferrin/lactoferrin family receptor n=1 Tax=Steroidobacter gossypii TaxID=2805490 RepID=A0ABS1WXK5_9GAMM|nr:TonB-dependent hemoglobin/transferrin/lactoferrin family receptor [Steroidobacter gossypii]MBM0105714.1 TonB-dependent hemoglobin/transferrin/lactoferrin family receptor [Steroidobacter gossypii]
MRTSSAVLSLAVVATLLSAQPIHAAEADIQSRQLKKIQVTAEEEGRSIVGNRTVVGVTELEEEQAQNFEDAIRYIPGVSIVDLGRFGDNGFNIRGLEGDRVALTVDGLAFAETVETTPAYEFFRAGRGSVDIDSVKSIEVVKGADSIVAGSGALGGAVMLVTKDAYDYLDATGNDTYFRIKSGYTSSSDELMTTATFANRTGPVEALALYTRRRGHETESWFDSSPIPTGSGRRSPDPMDRESDEVLAKLDFLIGDSQRFGLIGEYSRATNEIDNLSRVGGLGYLTRRADDDSDRDRFGLRYSWDDAGTIFDTLDWTADRVETKSRALTTILAGSGCAQNITPCVRSEDRATEQVLDRMALDFTKAWRGEGVSHALIYGLAWQQREVDFWAVDTRYIGTTDATSSVTIDPDQIPKTDVTTYSVYLRDSLYLLDDRLTLHAGIRYDRTEYSPELDAQFVDETGSVRDVEFSAPTWQTGVDFKLTSEHSVWAQVGRGFRAPTVRELYAPTSTSTATEVATGNEVTVWDSAANPNLKAEKSLNTELGYRWQTDRHLLGVSVYRDKYTDFVETVARIQNPDTQYQTCIGTDCTVSNGVRYLTPANVGDVVVKGVEVEGRWLINRQWSARLAWAYSEGEKQNGDPLPSILPATGVVGLRYDSPTQRWSLTGNVSHAEAKKMKDAALTQTPPDDFFTSLVPDYLSDAYTVLDLFGELHLTEDLRLNAGVYNVFDEKYYLWPRVRFVNEGTTTLYGYVTGDGIGRYSEPGRNFRVSLSWQF